MVRTFRVKVTATPATPRPSSSGSKMPVTPGRFASIASMSDDETVLVLPTRCQLWPDQKANGPFGERTAHCAEDVTKAWSAAFFSSMRRRAKGEEARLA